MVQYYIHRLFFLNGSIVVLIRSSRSHIVLFDYNCSGGAEETHFPTDVRACNFKNSPLPPHFVRAKGGARCDKFEYRVKGTPQPTLSKGRCISRSEQKGADRESLTNVFDKQ